MTRLNVLALVLGAGAIVHILRLVRLHQLRSKYALLWLSIAVLLVPLAVAPGLLDRFSDLLGIDYAPSALFLAALAFLFFVVVHFSWELSRLEAKVRALAEEIALLRAQREDSR